MIPPHDRKISTDSAGGLRGASQQKAERAQDFWGVENAMSGVGAAAIGSFGRAGKQSPPPVATQVVRCRLCRCQE